MPNPVQSRPHFLTPFPKGKLPSAYRGWKVLAMAFERRYRKHSKLLKPAEDIKLYQAWKNGHLEFNPVQNKRILLEVSIEHEGQSYFYHYPINLEYLFSPQWRRDNLSSPFGLFRWAIEMDTALRLNMVKGYEDLRLGSKSLMKSFSEIKKLEGKNCNYKGIKLSFSSTLTLNTLLVCLQDLDLLGTVSGNRKQVTLAEKTGVSSLGVLCFVLSSLENKQGKSWKEILKYNYINLPVPKVKILLEELEKNWEKYIGNHKQLPLAEKAGISHFSQLSSALSNLENSEGKSWVKVLKHKDLHLPVNKIKPFFNEFVDLVEENNLAYFRFINEFQKLNPKACQQRFLEIKNNFNLVNQVIQEQKKEDWPEIFCRYLLRTLPFLPLSKNPEDAIGEILEYIEKEKGRIDEIIRELPEKEISQVSLRQFTLTDIDFFRSIKRRKKIEALIDELNRNWKDYVGNHRQVALAEKIGVHNLASLFDELSKLKNKQGESWAEVLGYTRMSFPVSKVKPFFRELVDLVEESNLRYWRFATEFQKFEPEACPKRFLEIKNNFYLVKQIIQEQRRKDWPEKFYEYLLRTIPFFWGPQKPDALAKEILKYIEKEQDKIEQTLRKFPGKEISIATLRPYFGKFTSAVIIFYGGIHAVKRTKKIAALIDELNRNWRDYVGNHKQVALAEKIGISYLGDLFNELSNLENEEGKPWAEVLQYDLMPLSVDEVKILLQELDTNWKNYVGNRNQIPLVGNRKQIPLADKTSISHLRNLFLALTNLENEEGKPWAEVLQYDLIPLPVDKAKILLQELDTNWKNYVGNRNQIALADKAGIINLEHLIIALTYFKNEEGKRWAYVLGYNWIELPASKVRNFFKEFVEFVEKNNLPYGRFINEFKKLKPKECRQRFLEIRKNFNSVKQTIETLKKEDWPKEFHKYLLTTFPFLPSSENPEHAIREIMEYIEREQGKIDQILRKLPQEEISYVKLRTYFGKFTPAIVAFYGNIGSIRRVRKVEALLDELNNNWPKYTGNRNQIILAEKTGISSHLGRLFAILSKLEKEPGKSWTKVLGYNKIFVPIRKVKAFFKEFLDFVEENNLPYNRFVNEFQKPKPKECYQRFLEIKRNFYAVKQIIEALKREDWPEGFYKYLLRTIPFLPTSENPEAAAREILKYIEREQNKIDQTLRKLPEKEISYTKLRPHFGKFTLPVVKFYGNILSVGRIRKERLREILYLDLPIFRIEKEGYDTISDTTGLTPLEILLIKEETERVPQLAKALESLKGIEREIIERIYYKNEPLEEVAHSLGKDIETFDRWLETILRKLKRLMEVR